MKMELMPLGPPSQAMEAILACNSVSSRFGLALSAEQALALAEARQDALAQAGRVEFSGGILESLIFAFCDSPYIEQETYAETLEELARLFYTFKSETLDQVPDYELIDAMKAAFDGPPCYGSLELLGGKVLTNLARKERFRGLDDADEEEDAGEEEDGDA